MSRVVDAIYENGVFRPLEPVTLPERQRVGLTIQGSSDNPLADLLDPTAADSLDFPLPGPGGLEAVRKALSKIEGSLTPDFIAERDDRFYPFMPTFFLNSSAVETVAALKGMTVIDTAQPYVICR